MNVLLDPEQFDLETAPIEVKTRLLRRFSTAQFQMDSIYNRALEKIIEQIHKDLNKVEERQVIDLLVSCDNISGSMSINNKHLKRMSQNLATDIVTLVVDMAQKRSSLVDFTFLTDFYALILTNKSISPGLLQPAQRKLKDIMVEKLEDDDNREIIVKAVALADKFTFVANRMKNDELTLLCFDNLTSNFHKIYKMQFYVDLCTFLNYKQFEDQRPVLI